MIREVSIGLTVVACALSSARVASAQSADPTALATAVELFDAGQRLSQEGRYAEACPKFSESYRLDPQLGVLLNLADCLEHDGKLASAYAAFRDASELARKKGDDRQSFAEERSRALEPRLARITVEVPPAHRLPQLEIMRDGVPLGEGGWNVPIAIDPGEHSIVARAPGREPWRSDVVVSGEGASERVVVPMLTALAEPAAAAKTPSVASARPELDPADPGTSRRTLGFVVAGAGVVGLGAGAYFLVERGNKLDEADGICPSGVCAAGTRQASQTRIDSLTEDARSAQTISTVSFVAGGLLIATGVTLVLTAPKAAPPRQEARFSVIPLWNGRDGGVLARQSF